MADLTITTCTPVKVIEQYTGPAAAAVDVGEVVYLVAASGKFNLADEDASAPANEPEGVAIKAALADGDTITIVKKGLLDVGDALNSLNFGAPIYLSDTAGLMADADPGAAIVIGEVWPGWGATTPDKLLRVDI